MVKEKKLTKRSERKRIKLLALQRYASQLLKTIKALGVREPDFVEDRDLTGVVVGLEWWDAKGDNVVYIDIYQDSLDLVQVGPNNKEKAFDTYKMNSKKEKDAMLYHLKEAVMKLKTV